MSIEITYRDGPGCLVAVANGPWRTEDAKRAIEAIRAEADRRKQTRLLADLRGLSQPDSEMTRFYSGEHAARFWGHPIRAAVLSRPENYNRFGELVAVNRGADLAVFFGEEEALAWLKRDAE